MFSEASPRIGLALAVLGLQLGCDPFGTEFADVERAHRYEARDLTSPPQPGTELSVMSYNIKFGGGRIDFFFDCHGERVLMSKTEVETHLERLARKIRQVDPDVLFVQEAEVNSKRAAFIDQVQWLLDHTDLNYAVYASQWRADFVPSDGLGAVDSGNAIFSKWPLRDGTRIALPLRDDLSDIERYFYLRRNLLTARLELSGSAELALVNVHAESYAQDGTKKKHIDRFKQELDSLSRSDAVLGGGDLNALPPGTVKTSGFTDSVCTDDYQADDFSHELDWLDPLYEDYAEAISLDAYVLDNAPYFTHSTTEDVFWNRRLDYLFTSAEFVDGSGLVHQDEEHGGTETMSLSDHAPLTARLRID